MSMLSLPPRPRLDQGFSFSHGLSDHPLLGPDAISALARRLPPKSAEASLFGLVAEGGLDYRPPAMMDAGPAVAALDGRPESVYLYNVETDPVVGPLTRQILASLYPELDIDPVRVTKEEAYVFLSGGPSTTSAHVDHEHNFLILLRGHKRVFIADVPSPEGEHALEALHSGRYGSCAAVPAQGRTFDIGPGEGVYIAPRAAHYVVNGDTPCAALSIVFATSHLERQARVYAANATLRRMGITPTAPEIHPSLDRAKATTMSALRAIKSRMPATLR